MEKYKYCNYNKVCFGKLLCSQSKNSVLNPDKWRATTVYRQWLSSVRPTVSQTVNCQQDSLSVSEAAHCRRDGPLSVRLSTVSETARCVASDIRAPSPASIAPTGLANYQYGNNV
ncbi:hypothetical protein J6590_070257 [Homalodisca vitripennis]|nr:hypothetical protein J6590_070257 [Homalodisca vitripennis]